MGKQLDIESAAGPAYVSTGHLPPADLVQRLVTEAHARFRSVDDGQNAGVYPALAEVPPGLFGICVVGTSGMVFPAGDSDHEFSIMSVSKPFMFALVCELLGAEEARRLLGVNATGLPFNSVTAVEQSKDARTNPMVNSGAIATTSLAPGADLEERWRFIQDGLSPSPARSFPRPTGRS